MSMTAVSRVEVEVDVADLRMVDMVAPLQADAIALPIVALPIVALPVRRRASHRQSSLGQGLPSAPITSN